ncbi:MAG: TonB-dependent receptor, partial [Flavobacterium sp.]
YVDLALKFGESYELNVGARVEQGNKETKFREPGSFDAPFEVKKVDKVDVLPSINMKYKIGESSNLRLSASKTITRPVLMEAYPLEFVNLDGTIENGNEDIVNSDNYNFDLKFEIFPSNKELFAITAFSKYLQNPIERLFENTAGSGGQIITYDNSKKAVMFGAELEFLVQLDRLTENLSDFSLGFNTSLMYTKVNSENSLETNPERKLQGASPWLINADLKYEFDFSNTWSNSLSLVYNVYGKRIYAVGTRNLDHYYEMPFNKLDFIWSSKLSDNWDLKFAAENLLNPKYEIKMGEDSKKEIVEAHNFDEETFKQFHCYDLDFSLQVQQTHRAVVTFQVLLEHFSEGNYSKTWIEETLKLHEINVARCSMTLHSCCWRCGGKRT